MPLRISSKNNFPIYAGLAISLVTVVNYESLSRRFVLKPGGREKQSYCVRTLLAMNLKLRIKLFALSLSKAETILPRTDLRLTESENSGYFLNISPK